MTDFKQMTKLVRSILEHDVHARNSDSYLYLKVIEAVGMQKNMYVNTVPIAIFLQNMSEWGFPPFESVRRTRQKIQACFPDLAASERVQEGRAVNEEEYREFSRRVRL